jgi:shikimate dehydrogenase
MAEQLRAACIIGWPAGHSRSPLIHEYWLKTYGVPGAYRKEAIPPHELADFIANLRARGYVGANVTIPHKEAVLALSAPDERAKAIGAANTLWHERDRLRATNTDVDGFLANLDAVAPGWDRGLASAVVLGAGGSARAVVFGLIERGIKRIHVVNRTIERAQGLRQRFGAAVQPAPWTEANALLKDAGLLVNTTSLGMTGEAALNVDVDGLPAGAIVADLIYVPLVTALLAGARARGFTTADGLGMLLHQAVRGFELWFGVRPQVTAELRRLVEADLAGH